MLLYSFSQNFINKIPPTELPRKIKNNYRDIENRLSCMTYKFRISNFQTEYSMKMDY